MSIDINSLSSDELFALAQRRKKEEENNEARKAAIVVMKNRRKQYEAEHARALATIDSNIRGLHEQRAHVIIQHKTIVDQLDKELAELTRLARHADAQVAKQMRQADTNGEAADAAEPAAKTTSPAEAAAEAPFADAPVARMARPADTAVGTVFTDAVLAALEKRADISESLLKEQLGASGVDTTDLRRQLELLVRDGRLIHKGAGTYALGRRR